VNPGVYLRPQAEADIDEAAIWYEGQRTGLGQEFLDEVLAIFNALSKNPALYPVVHRRIRRALMRRFPFGIYFLAEADYIVVVAVMHGSRSPRRWQSRS
jgi:plasmid stabilization system protein ParE